VLIIEYILDSKEIYPENIIDSTEANNKFQEK